MDLFVTIIIWLFLLSAYGWRVIRPVLIYRDLVSGATTTKDAITFILGQGVIGGLISTYLFLATGFKSFTVGFIIVAFFLMAMISLYFGIKSWLWCKANR
jgi:glycerol-3-phosphate responsive antiterminator